MLNDKQSIKPPLLPLLVLLPSLPLLLFLPLLLPLPLLWLGRPLRMKFSNRWWTLHRLKLTTYLMKSVLNLCLKSLVWVKLNFWNEFFISISLQRRIFHWKRRRSFRKKTLATFRWGLWKRHFLDTSQVCLFWEVFHFVTLNFFRYFEPQKRWKRLLCSRTFCGNYLLCIFDIFSKWFYWCFRYWTWVLFSF